MVPDLDGAARDPEAVGDVLHPDGVALPHAPTVTEGCKDCHPGLQGRHGGNRGNAALPEEIRQCFRMLFELLAVNAAAYK